MKLKLLRIIKKLNQEELAKKAEISQPTLGRIERGG